MSKKLWLVVKNPSQQKLEESDREEKDMQATGIIVSRVEQELRESLRGLDTAYTI